MADIEVRALGWRFLLLFERRRPVPKTPSAPDHLQSHNGEFQVAYAPYDEREVTLGFGRPSAPRGANK